MTNLFVFLKANPSSSFFIVFYKLQVRACHTLLLQFYYPSCNANVHLLLVSIKICRYDVLRKHVKHILNSTLEILDIFFFSSYLKHKGCRCYHL